MGAGGIKTEDRKQKTERGGQKQNCQELEKNLAKTIDPVLQ
jgi:hypothetical protein